MNFVDKGGTTKMYISEKSYSLKIVVKFLFEVKDVFSKDLEPMLVQSGLNEPVCPCAREKERHEIQNAPTFA